MNWQYQQLTNFLLDKLPQRYRASLYSWIDGGKLLNEGKTETADGVRLAVVEYQAVFHFEDLPFAEINPAEIMAHLQIWLNEHSESHCLFDEYATPFEIELTDEQTAKLQFTLIFREPLTAVKDERGALQMDGENYRLQPLEFETAENVQLFAKIGRRIERIERTERG